MVSSAMDRHPRLDRAAEQPEAGLADFEREPQEGSRLPRMGEQVVGRLLRQIDDPPVVPEIIVEEFRVPVEAESCNQETLEMPGEKVGQVERARFRFVDLLEGLEPGIERIAVRTGEPL